MQEGDANEEAGHRPEDDAAAEQGQRHAGHSNKCDPAHGRPVGKGGRAEIAGKLRQPNELEKQTRRMLADPRSHNLATNFAGQWLRLRNLGSVDPNVRLYPDFDDNLRQAFRQETELFVDSVVREDRSVLELLKADYTFLNERLAKHYGIPNVYGSRFRRVALSDGARRGLLGHGSLLTVTSAGNRTSPVKRGKWILENLLGAPVPLPPPGVETNLAESTTPGATPTSVRQRLEQHRASPGCASCHAVMDPVGFSLEPFDLIGKYRDTDGGVPVNATGRLADGTALDGPASLQLRQHAGEMNPLPLPAGERLVVTPREMRHIGLCKSVQDDVLPVAARQAAADPLDSEAGDLEDRERKAEIGSLRHHHPAVREAPCRKGTQGLAIEANLATRWMEFTAQEPQERRLAGPVGADHGHHLAGPDVERHAVEDLDGAVGGVDRPELEDRRLSGVGGQSRLR